jgi:hypothetical protein
VSDNGTVSDVLATGLTVLAQTSDPEDFGLKAGAGAFWMFVALGAALVLLVLSMRRQFRRIDFDETAETDEDRMAQRDEARRPE